MTRNYSKVPDEKRQRLIELINQNMTIKDAARSVDIKYENAKAIYRVYRKEKRTEKCRNRFRYKLAGDPVQTNAVAKGNSNSRVQRLRQQPARHSRNKCNSLKDDDEDEEDFEMDQSEVEDEDEQSSLEDEAQQDQQLGGSQMTMVEGPRAHLRRAASRDKNRSNLTVVRSSQMSQIKIGSSLNSKNGAKKSKGGSTVQLRQMQDQRSQGLQDANQPVFLHNMTPFSEQSSQFLLAKNLTTESVVRELPQGAPKKPIKYDAAFFELMSKSGSNQTKDQLKSEYAQKFSERQESYKQSLGEYEEAMRAHFAQNQPAESFGGQITNQAASNKQASAMFASSDINQNGAQQKSLATKEQQQTATPPQPCNQQLLGQSKNEHGASSTNGGLMLQRASQNLAQTLGLIQGDQQVQSHQLVSSGTVGNQQSNGNGQLQANAQQTNSFGGKPIYDPHQIAQSFSPMCLPSGGRQSQQMPSDLLSQQAKAVNQSNAMNTLNAPNAKSGSGLILPFQFPPQFGIQQSAGFKLSQEMIDFRQKTPNDGAKNEDQHRGSVTMPSAFYPNQFQNFPKQGVANGQGLNSQHFYENRKNSIAESQAKYSFQNFPRKSSIPANDLHHFPFPNFATKGSVAESTTALLPYSMQHRSQLTQELNQPMISQKLTSSNIVMPPMQPSDIQIMDSGLLRALQMNNFNANQNQRGAFEQSLRPRGFIEMEEGVDQKPTQNLNGNPGFSHQHVTSPMIAQNSALFGGAGSHISELIKMPESMKTIAPQQTKDNSALMQNQAVQQRSGAEPGSAESSQAQTVQQNLLQAPQMHQGSGRIYSANLMNLSQSFANEVAPQAQPLANEPSSHALEPKTRVSVLQNNLNFVYDNDEPEKVSKNNTFQSGRQESPSMAKKQGSTIGQIFDSKPQQQHQMQGEPCGPPAPKPEKSGASIAVEQHTHEVALKNQTSQDDQSKAEAASFNQSSIIKPEKKKGTARRAESLKQINASEKQNYSAKQGQTSGNQELKDAAGAPRLPYMGIQQLVLHHKQLSLRHVQERPGPSSAHGNFDKITSSASVEAGKGQGIESQYYKQLSEMEPRLSSITGDMQARHIVSENLTTAQEPILKPKSGENQLYSQINKEIAQHGQISTANRQESLTEEELHKLRNIEENKHLDESVKHLDAQMANLQETGAQKPQGSEQGARNEEALQAKQSDKSDKGQGLQQSQNVPSSQQQKEVNTEIEKICENNEEEKVPVNHLQKVQPVVQQVHRMLQQPSSSMDKALNLSQYTMQNQSDAQNANQNLILDIAMDVKPSDSGSSSDSSYSAASDEHQVKTGQKKHSSSPQKPAQVTLLDKVENPRTLETKPEQIAAPSEAPKEVRPSLPSQESHPQTKQISAQNEINQPQKFDDLEHLQTSAKVKPDIADSQAPEAVKTYQQDGHASSDHGLHQQRLMQQHAVFQVQSLENQSKSNDPAALGQHDEVMHQVKLIQAAQSVGQQSSHGPENLDQRIQQVTPKRQQSEITRYLLNQLEQMHIKLKALGYCREDMRVKQETGSPKTIEQVFSTIDNFSNEVLSLHKFLLNLSTLSGQPMIKETIEQNYKMLQSLTSVVQLMQGELESAKSSYTEVQGLNRLTPPQQQDLAVSHPVSNPQQRNQQPQNVEPSQIPAHAQDTPMQYQSAPKAGDQTTQYPPQLQQALLTACDNEARLQLNHSKSQQPRHYPQQQQALPPQLQTTSHSQYPPQQSSLQQQQLQLLHQAQMNAIQQTMHSHHQHSHNQSLNHSQPHSYQPQAVVSYHGSHQLVPNLTSQSQLDSLQQQSLQGKVSSPQKQFEEAQRQASGQVAQQMQFQHHQAHQAHQMQLCQQQLVDSARMAQVQHQMHQQSQQAQVQAPQQRGQPQAESHQDPNTGQQRHHWQAQKYHTQPIPFNSYEYQKQQYHDQLNNQQ